MDIEEFYKGRYDEDKELIEELEAKKIENGGQNGM